MTRWTLGLVAAALLSAPAVAQEKPEDVIRAAIKAVGGEEVMRKYPAGESKMKGTMVLAGTDMPFTGKMVYSVPGRIRMDIFVKIGGQEVTMTQVVNGPSVKQTENGKPLETITEAAKTELMQGALLQEISLLYPLLDPAKYTLEKAEGRLGTVAVVVKGQGKDRNMLKPVTLTFEKTSGRLTKMARTGMNPSGDEVDEVTEYADYKDADGILVPMSSKVFHSKKLFLDISVIAFKPLAATDEKFDTGK